MAGRTWRAEARAALIAYPELKAELAERQQMKITAEYSLAPRGGAGTTRAVERAAMRQLPKEKQLKLEAVAHGLAMQEHLSAAQKRRRMVELVYWRRTHTLLGAAVEVGVSEETAKRWNADLLLLVWSWLHRKT